MNLERAEHYLRVYSYLNERDRRVVAREIASLTPGELITNDKLEHLGIKSVDVYNAFSKLSERYSEDFKMVWGLVCSKCTTRVGEMKEKVYELSMEDCYCNKCNCIQPVNKKLMYKILT